jgi:outer membrane lipoprotein-sorting protein
MNSLIISFPDNLKMKPIKLYGRFKALTVGPRSDRMIISNDKTVMSYHIDQLQTTSFQLTNDHQQLVFTGYMQHAKKGSFKVLVSILTQIDRSND